MKTGVTSTEKPKRKERQGVTHIELLDLTDKIRSKKVDLQKRFDMGLSGAQLARELNIPFTALRTALDHVQIDWNRVGRGGGKQNVPNRLSEEIKVLREAVIKIASELNIIHQPEWRLIAKRMGKQIILIDPDHLS